MGEHLFCHKKNQYLPPQDVRQGAAEQRPVSQLSSKVICITQRLRFFACFYKKLMSWAEEQEPRYYEKHVPGSLQWRACTREQSFHRMQCCWPRVSLPKKSRSHFQESKEQCAVHPQITEAQPLPTICELCGLDVLDSFLFQGSGS